MNERRRIQVQGVIQGVGFRPFVYRLAAKRGLSGFVRNESGGVTIEVEGAPQRVAHFVQALQQEAPPLAVVERLQWETVPAHNGQGRGAFRIEASRSATSGSTLVPPDVATCADCLREMRDPADRRYGYPFTNCTNCGPRFTIIRALPYDRPQTTMAGFALCALCRAEYEDPVERRFHAQPVACPQCGPRVQLTLTASAQGPDPQSPIPTLQSPLPTARRLLHQGRIMAIKGLGGYHLACDARNEEAVRRLRQGKGRPHKPLALMAADLATVNTICHVSEQEARLLRDARRPIVLLRRRQEADVAPAVAPGQASLGVMLPYTPLHTLLFAADPGEQVTPLLVMTSGNRAGEPMVVGNEEAREKLGSVADALLSHDRPIQVRCDDSVARVVGGDEDAGEEPPLVLLLRRSRGYAPQPLHMAFDFPEPLLAVGAHQKNSFCLGRGRHAYVSQHIGDLDSVHALLAFRDSVAHFQELFDVRPRAVAHDLHPDYLSTRFAREQDLRQIGVQHHHAHVASVLAEHALEAPVIGVAFDGSGYGPDGTVWGGEFLVAGRVTYERVAHLAHCPLPGGEQAVRQPWRVAAAWLTMLYGEAWQRWRLPFCRDLDRDAWDVLQQMMARDVNCPLTSSVGRLFDAVAALLGLRGEVSYEGQAAMELEALADTSEREAYPFGERAPAADGAVSPAPLFAALLQDLRAGVALPLVSARFHNGLAQLVADVCEDVRGERGLNRVALSGGVFQNGLLLARARRALTARGFEVYVNCQVPPNDGGIALGQAAVAAAVMAKAEQKDGAPASLPADGRTTFGQGRQDVGAP